MANYNSPSKHPHIQKIQKGICPSCNKQTLQDITGTRSVSHISDCGMHLYYKEYSGYKCAICGLSNATYKIVQ